MASTRRVRWIVIGVIVLVVAIYAGYNIVYRASKAIRKADTAHDLEDIALAYVHYYGKHKKWPSRPEELQPHLTRPEVYPKLQAGQYIVVWDAYQREKSTNSKGVVLVYEKDAPIQGGFVCYRDARFENLTAAEVQATLAAAKQ
jgi:hypothetical protein